jgi:hypothetical protein
MGGKVRVKLRTIMAGDHGTAHPGDVIEVPAHVADELLRSKQAEAAPPLPGAAPPAAPAAADDQDDDEPETASNPPAGETATVRRPRLRRG